MSGQNFMAWYGAIVIGGIALSLLFQSVKAVRAGRFGFSHIAWTDVLGAAIALIMGSLFFYGWFRYPDAPIYKCSGGVGYCGKQGQPHSRADYQAFELWQTVLFILWPVGMLAMFFLGRGKRRN